MRNIGVNRIIEMKEYGEKHNFIYQGMGYYLRSYYRGIFEYLKIPKVQDKNALDVGCGHGYLLELFENQGYKPYALDLSAHSLKRAKDIVPRATIVIHDAQLPFPFPLKFDLITCFGLLGLLNRPHDVIKNCYNALKKGGIFIASAPNKFGFINLFFGGKVAWAVREKSIKTLILPRKINSNCRSPGEWRETVEKFKWRKLKVFPLQRIPLSKNCLGKYIFFKFPLGDPVIIFGTK